MSWSWHDSNSKQGEKNDRTKETEGSEHRNAWASFDCTVLLRSITRATICTTLGTRAKRNQFYTSQMSNTENPSDILPGIWVDWWESPKFIKLWDTHLTQYEQGDDCQIVNDAMPQHLCLRHRATSHVLAFGMLVDALVVAWEDWRQHLATSPGKKGHKSVSFPQVCHAVESLDKTFSNVFTSTKHCALHRWRWFHNWLCGVLANSPNGVCFTKGWLLNIKHFQI